MPIYQANLHSKHGTTIRRLDAAHQALEELTLKAQLRTSYERLLAAWDKTPQAKRTPEQYLELRTLSLRGGQLAPGYHSGRPFSPLPVIPGHFQTVLGLQSNPHILSLRRPPLPPDPNDFTPAERARMRAQNGLPWP
jgi:hypothetical protein